MLLQMLRKFKSVAENAGKEYKNFKLDYSYLPQKSKNVYEQMSKDFIHLYQVRFSKGYT